MYLSKTGYGVLSCDRVSALTITAVSSFREHDLPLLTKFSSVEWSLGIMTHASAGIQLPRNEPTVIEGGQTILAGAFCRQAARRGPMRREFGGSHHLSVVNAKECAISPHTATLQVRVDAFVLLRAQSLLQGVEYS